MSDGVLVGQLQAFIEAARHGNVTRAADALFLTQPALSARLKRLEQEVGVVLLQRDHKGAQLTEAGMCFLPYAERIVRTMTEAQGALRSMSAQIGGELVVATTQTVNGYLLPGAIAALIQRAPTVRLSVRTATSEGVLEMVLDGTADLGLARLLPHPEVSSTLIYEEEYLFVVGADHSLSGRLGLTVQDLVGETLVTLFRSVTYRTYMEGILRRYGLVLRTTIDLDNIEAGKNMLMASPVVGLLPQSAIRRELAAGTLTSLDIVDMPALHRSMVALQRVDALPRELTTTLVELLAGVCNGLGLPVEAPVAGDFGVTP